jgi:DNA-binding transcriptional regulator PaaX
MARINISDIILSAIKDIAYLPVVDKYAFTKQYKALLDHLFDEEKITKQQKYNAKKIIDRLIKNKLLSLAKNGRLELTEEGKKKLHNLEFKDFKISKPKVWDGKYRVIIFDIGVEKNRIRDAVRRQLSAWGFVRVQDSVWANPYECREVITLLKNHFGVNKNVLYITAESIENDIPLKKLFNLN